MGEIGRMGEIGEIEAVSLAILLVEVARGFRWER